MCKICDSTCLNCISLHFCLSCSRGKFLHINTCVDNCPNLFWADFSENICRPHCNSPTFFDRQTKMCVYPCPQNYYGEELNRTCVPECPTTGASMFVFNQTICKYCESNCLTCEESENKCTSCSPDLYLDNSTNYCQPSCAKNFCPKQGRVCVPCPEGIRKAIPIYIKI